MFDQEDYTANAILDYLRSQLPDTAPWPQDDAYVLLQSRARALVQAATPDFREIPPPGDVEVQAATPDLSEIPPLGDAEVDADLDIPPAPVAELRPGEVPNIPLPLAAVSRLRLVVDIERNAREGEPYRSSIAVRTSDGRPLDITGCAIPPGSGVSYLDGTLTAVEPRPGEYVVRLTCALNGESQDAEALLIVNPDPRTLWKSLDSDRDAPGWKPDSVSERVYGAGGRQIHVASRRGRSHAHTGAFRDDDFALHVTGPEGWNVLAVADGAGSAKRSRIGSRVAAHTAVAVAAEKLQTQPYVWPVAANEANATDLTAMHKGAYNALGAAAFEALRQIEAKASDQGMEPRDYATTLLLVAHRSITGGELVLTFWVGDGAIAIFDTGAGVRILGHPDSGEFAGQTRFLDRDVMANGTAIMSRIHAAVVPHFDAIMVMTDGVSDPWFPSETALRQRDYWDRLWMEITPLLAPTSAPGELADWLDFWSGGHHDDRTLALIR